MAQPLAFYAQFIASAVGANGLTVTWDVERVTRADGTRAALLTGAATNITVGRRGLYGYLLADSDLKTYDYVATAITAGTADQKEIAAMWSAWVPQQDLRDAMKLAPTAGDPAAGSVDAHLDLLPVLDDLASADELADAAWDEALSGHLTAGTTGKALNDASTAAGAPTAAEIADAVHDELLSGHTGAGTAGKALSDAATGANRITADYGATEKAAIDLLDDASGGLADVHAHVAAILDDTGTSGVVVASHTTAAKAELQAEAEDALETYDLDHLIQVTAGSEEPTDGSYLDQIMHKDAGQTFSSTTDSLEALAETLIDPGVSVVGAVDGGTVTVYTYSRWSVALTGLGSLADRSVGGLYFTVKREPRDEADTVSMLQVKETTGALYINRAAAASAAYGTLVVDNETTGAVTLTVTAAGVGTMSAERGLRWEVKKITAAGPVVVARGAFHIEAAVARATS